MNLLDLFAIPRWRTPDQPALRFREEGREEGRNETVLSYHDLFAAADALASGLAAQGLAKGDRVAFFLGNRPEFVIAYLAVIRLGAVMVPINLAYRQREIVHMLGDAEPRLLITERTLLPILDEMEERDRRSLQRVILAEELDRLEADADGLSWPVVTGSDPAMLLYTSGTTGRSKGAVITHDNVLATMTGLLAAWAWEPADALLLTLPLFHTHGLVVGLHCALAAGATVLLRRRFDAAEVADDLLAGEPTLFFGVPTMYVRLVEELRRRSPAEPARQRLFCSGSAPLAPETFAAFRELTGQDILERYGMTETGMNLSNPYAGPRLPGTVGTPLPGVSIRIVNREDRDLPAGTEGDLLVAGSNVFDGYWRAPEKTAESFVHDDLGRRWFRTGDLAREDPETGYVTLLGRSRELILTGGFNVYPREVEEVLATFAGVREAAVVGRPHPEWGEVPVAFLVADSALDETALVAFCKSQMAGFKVPRRFEYVESLPRNALGKVQKHLLPG
ncbi:MAG: malonyl-CoA/methylmalonyl-CoA synthetase [Acidobacteriota bacterium]|jgi:malonyl-CoA/methylmalonyl-CoA synthetase|nr:malonyl-CoA/methylmalonyl-CoA synthetase [Acidobacteriota bacterium]